MNLHALKLRTLLAAAFSALTLATVGLVGLALGRVSAAGIEDEIGKSLAMLADQMQDKLDRGLYERFRETINAASLIEATLDARGLENHDDWLERMQATYPDYGWIGIADHTGKVVSSTHKLLMGSSVARERWFEQALVRPYVGDVRENATLGRLLGNRDDEPSQFMDFAAPIRANGITIGVIGAQLAWSWASEVMESLLGTSATPDAADVMVLDREGRVLLGPREIRRDRIELESFAAARSGRNRYSIEIWPDGRSYMTGFAKSDGYRQFAGLDWLIFVRQDSARALAPVRRLQLQVLGWSLLASILAALAAWTLAGRISQPLLNLAESAERIRRREPASLPELHNFAEAETLSRSLGTLVTELTEREATLARINTSLEAEVERRTRELALQNAALREAKEEAELATTAKSRFLAAASHDLRQPLHALTLFARALSRRVESSDARSLVGQMERALAGLKEMFDALLNISRLDAGVTHVEVRTIALSDVLERVSVGFRAEAVHRSLRFTTVPTDLVVRTDPVILETMLRNLISNALKFTPRGGVLIGAHRRGGMARIDVFDTGPGIPEEARETIFKEFERSPRDAHGPNEGLGLGLSLVRRYASLLGLEVAVRSRPGRGSRFSICALPIAAPAEARPERVQPQPGMPADRLSGFRILVLDDQPLIVAALARELGDLGNTVHEADCVARAEEAWRGGGRPDLAVVDLNLGGPETGLEFIERMERATGSAVPTLVLTGATDRDTLARLDTCGRAWLTKPADPIAVACALAAAVKARGAAASASSPMA